MKKLLIIPALALVGCGSATVASSTPDPTAVATPDPTPVPTPTSYHVQCSWVVTYQGSEVGIVADFDAGIDSSTACPQLGQSFSALKDQGATVQELDGQALDFTVAGPDIKVACSTANVHVYEHTSDPVSVTLAGAFCQGLTKGTVS